MAVPESLTTEFLIQFGLLYLSVCKISFCRVLNYLQDCHDRERHLTSVLSIGPEDHVKVADKINRQAKSSTKKLQNVLKEVAGI